MLGVAGGTVLPHRGGLTQPQPPQERSDGVFHRGGSFPSRPEQRFPWPLASSAHGEQPQEQPAPWVLELRSAVAVRWVVIGGEGRRESGAERALGEKSLASRQRVPSQGQQVRRKAAAPLALEVGRRDTSASDLCAPQREGVLRHHHPPFAAPLVKTRAGRLLACTGFLPP